MSPRITILSGIAAGTSHRIESRVARVGSDPQSDICLPTAEIPAHALTLEFRGESCRVYNRCRASVYVGGLVIAPDDAAEWPQSDVLQLGDEIELALSYEDAAAGDLEFDDFCSDDSEDGQASPGNFSAGDGTIASSEPDTYRPINQSASKSSSGKTMVQVFITMMCIVGAAYLLIRDQQRHLPTDTGVSFSDVVNDAITNPVVSQEMIQRLQYAEAQRVRGRIEEARSEFQAIRDALSIEPNLTSGASEANEELKARVLRFIQSRLAADT